MENNPCLTEQGVVEGEIIGIPVEDTDPPSEDLPGEAEEGAALVNGPEAN